MIGRSVVAFLGPSRSGKDHLANVFASVTGLRRCPSCSEIILPFMATRLGVPLGQAWEERHLVRDEWRRCGDDLRRRDPAALVRATLMDGGRIVVGIRSVAELEASIAEGLVSDCVWVQRPGVPRDETLEFGYRPGWALVHNDPDANPDTVELMEELALRLGYPISARSRERGRQ